MCKNSSLNYFVSNTFSHAMTAHINMYLLLYLFYKYDFYFVKNFGELNQVKRKSFDK